MKQNRMTKLLTTGTMCLLAFSTLLAQETSTTTTTTTTGSTGTSENTGTATLSGMGTITAAPSGDYITFRTESSTEPVKYYYTANTTAVDPTGQTVQISTLRPDMPVHFTYVKDGDRMVVTKVMLEKPITYYEKKETTTTTTTTNP